MLYFETNQNFIFREKKKKKRKIQSSPFKNKMANSKKNTYSCTKTNIKKIICY